MAAAVVIGSLNILSHCEKTRLDLISTLLRSYLSARNVKRTSFSSVDGKVTSFQDIPQSLLFAEVRTDEAAGCGSLRYNYNTTVNGVEKTYAWVSFSWDRERLKAEFLAEIDETEITAEFNMPVECRLETVEGAINGVTGCYLAFGDKRFFAPAGMDYQGSATISRDEANKQVYRVNLKNEAGFIVKKISLPEL
jgi:hypothetical protein